MVEMKVRGLAVDASTRQPVVILMDSSETRFLPIWIGVFEADAILVALEDLKAPRPATHDLLKSLLEALGASLDRITIHDFEEKTATYFAQLEMKDAQGAPLAVDARPSDSIALALRTGADIYVAENVLVQNAVRDMAKINQQIDDFKKFLQDVKPEDFARFDREKGKDPGGEGS